MIYILEAYTWYGMSLGAKHYYGNIRTHCRCKDDFKPIQLPDKLSKEAIIQSARAWFKRNAKRGDLMLMGSSSIRDPLPCIIGPRVKKTELNSLYKAAEAIDFWEENESAMKLICKRWDKAIEECT